MKLIHHSIEEVIKELGEKNQKNNRHKIIVLVEYNCLEICFRVTVLFLTVYF